MQILLPRASFTRPANTTQYAAGDLVANSATAGDVAPMIFPTPQAMAYGGQVRRARLYKSDDDVTAPTFRLHLFSGDPTATAPQNGDNGALLLKTSITEYLGSIALDLTAVDIYNTAGNADAGVPLAGEEINFRAYQLYGLLAAVGTYTPASAEVFTAELEVIALDG